MGAGITKKQERDRKRNWLKSICRDLCEAGVPAVYDNMQVSGPGFDVRCGPTARCSNGEAFGNLLVTVGIPAMPESDWKYEVDCGDTHLGFEEWKQHMLDSHADTIETYHFLEATDYGLRRLKSLYGDELWRSRQAETEVAWLITKIERAAKRQSGQGAEGSVFLYRADGTLWPSPESFGMAAGQLYAYNEMQNGKPMLRVGQGSGKSDYTEFLPGMRVVREDGKVIAERRL